MTLYVHRSRRSEDLLSGLVGVVRAHAPKDPFEPFPIMVGSRGMERWLRHELATQTGSAASLAFPMPGAALDAALRWLLDEDGAHGASTLPNTSFWERRGTAEPSVWAGEPLVRRVLSAMRARLDSKGFEAVARYLAGASGDAAVNARELCFARDVASVVERLLADRPREALAWVEGDGAPAQHLWIAELLRDLHASTSERSPAQRVVAFDAMPERATGRTLAVFGLSTLRPGDKLRLEILSRFVDVRLFVLAPSSKWWGDLRIRGEEIRALKRARRDHELVALLGELGAQNALLASNGGPSRDLQAWLEEQNAHDVTPECAWHDVERTTLLSKLQGWIDDADDTPKFGAWSDVTDRTSLQFHVTYGALRSCEALRDELLRRFAADETLEPRHVLVMTPDVATYAPLIEAVFARHGRGASDVRLPSIPVTIGDLGLRATNPVAEALMDVLALAQDRVTASKLVDALSLQPVREKFGLHQDDLDDVRRMIVESGIRWAWNRADRTRHVHTSDDANTVAFGLERLALGALMPDAGGLSVVVGPDDASDPVVPYELESAERVARFGRLAKACAVIEAEASSLVHARTTAEWRADLERVVGALTEVSSERAWLRKSVLDVLESVLPASKSDGLRYDLSAITERLAGEFDLPRQGPVPPRGAVTVCALEPMRSVPFRVVALVGMDGGAFPRSVPTPMWSPFAVPAFAEYDRAAVDRHMFLEALLSARDVLLVFGTGFEPKQGKEIALSTVVSELTDVLARGLGVKAKSLFRTHPLQPWSRDGFLRDARHPYDVRPFEQRWADAALALGDGTSVKERALGLQATPLDAKWPDGFLPKSEQTLAASAIARAVAKPQRELLKNVLQITPAYESAEVEDGELIEADTIEEHGLREAVLEHGAARSAEAREALERRLRGEGRLPAGAAGGQAIEEAVTDCETMAARVDLLLADVRPGAAFSCTVARAGDAGVVVSASSPEVGTGANGDWLLWRTPSKSPNQQAVMEAWVSLLVAKLDPERGSAVRGAVVVGCDSGPGKAVRALIAPAAPEALLADLLELREALRRGPLLLFPRLSPAVAKLRDDASVSDSDRVAKAAEAEWVKETSFGVGVGDLGDWYVDALFGLLGSADLVDLAEPIVELAERVWGPIHAANQALTTGKPLGYAKSAEAPKEPKPSKAAKEPKPPGDAESVKAPAKRKPRANADKGES